MKEHFRIEGNSLFYDGPAPESLEGAWDITMTKWEILKASAQDGNRLDGGGTSTCGLCLFYPDSCRGCPIDNACVEPGGPYDRYCGSTTAADAAVAAEAELAFLKRIKEESDD